MPIRLFLITFDIPGARPGDRRYGDVDRYLARIGAVHKPLKQVRLIVTDAPPPAMTRAIRWRIGMRGNISVLRIARYSTVDFADPVIQATVRSLIRRHGRR
jgi:hypothetical protein